MIVNSLMCHAHSVPRYEHEPIRYTCDREIEHAGLHHDFAQNMYWLQTKDAGGQPSGMLIFDPDSYWSHYIVLGEPDISAREPEECYVPYDAVGSEYG